MKINVEFNSVAEMVNFSKFVGNDLVTPNNIKNSEGSDGWTWKAKFERTEANLERAYERIREFEALKKDNPKIAAEIMEMELERELALEAERKRLEKDSIDLLELAVRPYNCLKAENILTLTQLVGMTENELLKIPNMGKLSLKDIKTELARLGLKLKKSKK